ncbi:MAG TPA: hypothetical protein PLN81_05225 [Bacillota bacterium]|nr:hypothetical protein [Bacillota bacterium]HPT60982.1 hypothetical protein [Bacillota bacterium]
MDIKDLEKALMKEWAQKAMEALGEEKRKELISIALFNTLNHVDFKWETKKVMEEYAYKFANEYIQQEAFQQKLREKVAEAITKVTDKFLAELVKQFSRDFKWAGDSMDRELLGGNMEC